MSLFDNLNIYADIASNAHGDLMIFTNLLEEIQAVGAIPKIQLWSQETFPRTWDIMLPPDGFVASVFRPSDIDFILPYRPLALKVASVESTHWELIRKCIETELPLIVSTGGMDEDELIELIEWLGPHSAPTCLMHCVSLYPTRKEDLNLYRLTSIGEAIDDLGYDIALGWSSHYPVVNPKALTMAYCFGATQFETHVRYDLGNPATWTIDFLQYHYMEQLFLDEQCALLPEEIKGMRTQLEELHILEGSDQIVGPDREAVLSYRKRWQG